MDLILPLLLDHHCRVSIAQLLASVCRQSHYCMVVTEWSPHEERAKEVKSKRGWEKTAATMALSPNRQGGWVIRTLISLSQCHDPKVRLLP